MGNSNVLVTGGAGFIGTHLVKAAAENGHTVRIFDNLSPQVHGPDPVVDQRDCEFVLGDVRSLDQVSAAMENIDVVFHLAAETGVGQSQYEIERYISTNTLGTAVVLQAAVQAGVKHLVIASSRAVYGEGLHQCESCGEQFVPVSRSLDDLSRGDWEVKCSVCGSLATALPMKEEHPPRPGSIYGLTKLQQEQIAANVGRVHHLPVTNLRFFNVFGPGQSLTNPYVGVLGTFFRRIKAGEEIDLYEDGKMLRDFVYVEDVVDAILRVVGNEKTYGFSINVGTGLPVTLEEAGLEMFRQLGAEPKINRSSKFRSGDIHHAVADTGLTKELLGFVPSTTFGDGLQRFVAWANDREPIDRTIDSNAEDQLRRHNLLGQATP